MTRLLFLSRESGAEILLIDQIVADSPGLPIPLPWLDKESQEIDVDISGYAGKLVTGEREDGRLVNGVYWKTDDFYFVVVTTQSLRELLTLARSMR